MSEVKFKLLEILNSKGLKPHKFAIANNFNYVAILRICRNETHGITLGMIARLCEALDIQPGDLFDIKK